MTNYVHTKSGKIYTKFEKEFINATNDQDGQIMVGYYNSIGQMFVRESREFYKKFTKIK